MSVDIHALSGAYAVDAVDDIERAQFERHLADCPTCRAEVDSLRAASALISETSAVAAPESLRASVLAGIQNVRPMPPVMVAAAEAGRSTRRRFPALVAAAAALIAIGGAGATVWHPWSNDQQQGGIYQAADLQSFKEPLPDGGSVEVARSKSLNQAVLSTHGMPELDAGQTYALWFVHDDTYVLAGSMDGDARSVLLEGNARTATAVGITVEDSEDVTEPDLDSAVVVPLKQT
jgi:hypothetical protein